ncbi:hypothetical protein ACFYP4_02305 [Streptomyces sp. NPDC005551]|uniref:hypothetical protein n=1 Tax=Streptomyces sp. NPDC005551 TaxID=3364725 RepID=UPI0036BCC227
MQENRVRHTFELGIGQCGNQLAYGLPGSEYCSKYKAPGFEWCQECCENIFHDSPGTSLGWRGSEPFVMLTFFAPSGDIFVWPQRGQDIEAQRGHVFVFGHESYLARQMRNGRQSFNTKFSDGELDHWDDVISVYEGSFRELGDLTYGLSYSLDSLKEIAGVYGKPVPAKS